MTDLPKYISWQGHGEISHEVPLNIGEVTSYIFILRADVGQLQHFVDVQLNAVSGGAVRYKAVPFVWHTWLEALHVTSVATPIGYLSDREAAFLVPVLQRKQGELFPKLRFWAPYLLIDQANAMVTGREVWGYSKTLGTIGLPRHIDKPAHFTADTTLFKTFAPTTKGEYTRLFTVQSGTSLSPLHTAWTSMAQAWQEILQRLQKVQPLWELERQEEQAFLQDINDLLAKREVPVITLKQFRDATDSAKACYQALVECPNRVDQWSGGGWLDGKNAVEITTCASHRIVQDLGLGDLGYGDHTVVPILFGCWMKFAFTTLAGRVIWQWQTS